MGQLSVTIDGRTYVPNIVETLFNGPQTAHGEYVKTKNTVYFFHGNGSLEGCIIANPKQRPMWACATLVSEGIWHSYADTIFEQNSTYSQQIEAAQRIWDELAQAKVHTKAYAIKKAKTKQAA